MELENKKEDKNDNSGSEDVEYIKVRKSDIIVPNWLPREPKIVTDADLELRESIIERGLLNPLTVRRIKGTNKFELLAGRRRFGAILEEEIYVHIIKDDSEYEARIDCGTENEQRAGLADDVRDKYYYQTFMIGKEEGKIKTVRDMAKDLAINFRTLKKYIDAGEERAKNKNNDVLSKASTSSLTNTRTIKDMPNVRNILLEMEQQKIIQQKNIPEIMKKIVACKDSGVSEKMITKMINRNKYEVNKKLIFNIDEFDEISSVVAISPTDVREAIVSEKIAVTDAEDINRFKTVEQRRQMIEEKIKFNTWEKQSVEFYKEEWHKNTEIREKQVLDIENNGATNLRTKLDIEKQNKMNLEISKDQRHDDEYFNRWKSIKSNLNATVLNYHPNKLRTNKGKESVKFIIRESYSLLRLLMIEIGDIKTDPKVIEVKKSEDIRTETSE